MRLAIALLLAMSTVVSDRALGQVAELPQGPHHAVVIGVDRAQGIPALQQAEADARRTAKALSAQGWKVRLVVRGEVHEPLTAEIVLEHIREVARGVPATGTVLVAFSGHGGRSGGKSYLFAQATHPDRLETSGIGVDEVLEILSTVASDGPRRFRSILLVDACRNPVGTRGVRAADWAGLKVAEGHGALFGTQSGKTSEEVSNPFEFEGDRVVGGLFSHFLVKSLSARETDTNGDGVITLPEVETYVTGKMLAVRNQSTIEQKPHLEWSGSGQLVLARAPRDVTPPVVTLTEPKNEARLERGLTKIHGDVTDDSGVAKVMVYVDDEEGRTATLSGRTWSLTLDLRPGAHRILVQALDRAENPSSRVKVVVQVGGAVIPPVVREPERSPPPTGARVLTGLTAKGKNEQGYEEYTLDKDPSVVMILVPGGEFTMGSTDGDEDEKPTTRVRLGTYLIGKYETTWSQYGRFCAATGRKMAERPEWAGDDHPVVNVDWSDARDYGAWAGLRLPTEAEWEYAARGGDGRKWPWGDDVPTGAGRWCNVSGNEDGYANTSPVGSFPKGVGPFGTMDQAGNVWEWCSDWYAPYPGGSVANPRGPSSASFRLFRGGSWSSGASFLRGAYRDWSVPGYRYVILGFRLASQVTP